VIHDSVSRVRAKKVMAISERRIGSIKLPSPAPVSALPGRSRLSRQAQPATGVDEDGDDIDAEGEEDAEEEEGEEGEDKGIYCFCQKMSYGEVSVCGSAIRHGGDDCAAQMVACDGKDCPYQWVSEFQVHYGSRLRKDSSICRAQT
jgi:hypothetical protein